MNRIKTVDIAGKEYYLNFSVHAADVVHARYGGFDGINAALGVSDREEKDVTAIAEELAWVLGLLIFEGAQYQKIVNNIAAPVLDEHEIKTVLSIADLLKMRLAVLDAIGAGFGVTIEVQPDKKNESTAQA